jgi:hypothetical protein
MTADEKARLLKAFLDDYDRHGQLVADMFDAASSGSVEETEALAKERRALEDSIHRRLAPAGALVRAAKVPPLNDRRFYSAKPPEAMRASVLMAIGVYEHGHKVGPSPASAPEAKTPGLQERIQNHWVRWAVVWVLAGGAGGYFIRDLVDAAVARRVARSAEAPAKWGK